MNKFTKNTLKNWLEKKLIKLSEENIKKGEKTIDLITKNIDYMEKSIIK